MEISVVLKTALCAVVIVNIVKVLYKRYQLVTIIDKIPGPKAYPILGNLLDLINVSREDLYAWTQALSGSYEGGIFRTWMGISPIVHLSAPETISVILPNKDLITKSAVYYFLDLWLGTGLVTGTGDKWHRQRKLINPTFHSKVLEQFAVVISDKAEILKKCITSQLESNPNESTVDVSILFYRCTLDIICESVMGININAQTIPDAEYSVAIHSIAAQTVERMLRPWFYLDWMYYRTACGQRFKNTVEIADKFTNQVIHDRKVAREMKKQNLEQDVEDIPKRQGFLDHLLDTCERDNTTLTDKVLREEVNTFMFAGHDTTAVALSFALFCIGNHTEVEEKIHEEQLRVFGDSIEPPTLHQISELKYLERVIKETLRLFPSVPVISRTSTEDFDIGGYKIPNGVFVCLHLYRVHRDPKHWSDPDRFDPDRFLPENSHDRHPYAYVPFSSGPRNCIGQKFAMMELIITLTAVLRKWRVKSLAKFNDIKYYSDLVLKPQNGMMVQFTHK